MTSVLVVEDDALLAYALAGNLRDVGYRVIGPAANLTAAKRLLADNKIDVACLDVRLGESETSVPLPTAWRLSGSRSSSSRHIPWPICRSTCATVPRSTSLSSRRPSSIVSRSWSERRLRRRNNLDVLNGGRFYPELCVGMNGVLWPGGGPGGSVSSVPPAPSLAEVKVAAR